MQHLFIVHSPIMVIAAQGVVRHLGLPPDEIAVLAYRGVKAPPEFSGARVFGLEDPRVPVFRERMPLLQRMRMIKAMDAFISDELGAAGFHAYLPHTILPWMQLIATHPDCVGFSYLEEGMLNYRSMEDVARSVRYPLRYWPRWHRAVLGRRLGLGMPFDRRAAAAYGLGQGSFTHAGLRTVLVGDEVLRPSTIAPSPSVLCCLTHTTALHRLSNGAERWKRARRLLAEGLARIGNEVLLKFHPDEKPPQQEELLVEFNAAGVRFTVLERHVSPELLLRDRPCRLVHFGSSVALYAAIMGVPVYNALPLLPGAEADALKQWRAMKASLSAPLPEVELSAAMDELR